MSNPTPTLPTEAGAAAVARAGRFMAREPSATLAANAQRAGPPRPGGEGHRSPPGRCPGPPAEGRREQPLLPPGGALAGQPRGDGDATRAPDCLLYTSPSPR